MRFTSSCSTCRSRKRKCVPLIHGVDCQYCTERKLKCDLVKIQNRQTINTSNHVTSNLIPRPASQYFDNITESGDVTFTTDSEDEILQLTVCDELLALYFDMFHNKQQIIFHRNTFFDEKQAGNLPEYLILGVLAITAR